MDGGFACVGPLADFALIRRWRATFPLEGEGYYGLSIKYRDNADLSVKLRSRTEKVCTTERSLPPGGEGGAKRWMRAKQASVVHNATHPLRPRPRMAECVTRCVQATEIPPAGAPPGGRGSLCGNDWLHRSPLNPVCRYDEVICSEMTRWGAER